MVRSIVIAGALSAFAVSAVAELDLTPVETFYEIEGIRSPNLTFRDGSKPVTYTPPLKWKPSGGGSRLTLLPPDRPQAEAVIEAALVKDPLPITDENLKAYSELALAMVPREASKVQVLEAIPSPLRISKNPLAEVTLSYVFFGQETKMAALFLPRGQELIRFKFVCRAADFQELYKAFQRSLFSLSGLEGK